MSLTTHDVLNRSCGSSNILNTKVDACWNATRAKNVTIDTATFLDTFSRWRKVALNSQAVCEAQARVTPVFFLWYEDLLDDMVGVVKEMQRFLGVSEMTPHWRSQKVNVDPATWITNYAELRQITSSVAVPSAVPSSVPSCSDSST